MSNDSSTGGPLLPIPSGPAPLEGQALNRFLQQWVAALTGLPGNVVLPRWQADPANIPDAGTSWAAIGVTQRVADNFPHIHHDPTGEGTDILIRHESLTLGCSFFDLGTNGQADYYAALLRDGSAIAQNREIFDLNGFALVNVGETVAVPVLTKQRWMYRVDMNVFLRRAIERSYPVLNLQRVQGTIVNDDGDYTLPFDTGVIL